MKGETGYKVAGTIKLLQESSGVGTCTTIVHRSAPQRRVLVVSLSFLPKNIDTTYTVEDAIKTVQKKQVIEFLSEILFEKDARPTAREK